MKLKLYQVDAFARGVFTGNPAAVVLLDAWLADECLQAVAAENNLSETAFLVGGGADWELRWFTPNTEVALCGHATLGAAHILFERIVGDSRELRFATRKSGTLVVERRDNSLAMDFPALVPKKVEAQPEVNAALGVAPASLWEASYSPEERDLLAVFDDVHAVASLTPDFPLLAKVPCRGIICTAPGADVDFVSRFFAPAVGVPEDPFTGSAHCILTPYWAERLEKEQLSACQISQRKGWAHCRHRGDRIELLGDAVTYLAGEIYV